jgi:hypothetical protein
MKSMHESRDSLAGVTLRFLVERGDDTERALPLPEQARLALRRLVQALAAGNGLDVLDADHGASVCWRLGGPECLTYPLTVTVGFTEVRAVVKEQEKP